MAGQRIDGYLSLALMVVLFVGTKAQSSSCTNTLISLSPCLNYIQGNSSTPSSGCCSQLASVVKTQPQCLCQVLSGGGSTIGISVNQTQAMALPGACNVQTPPASRCSDGSSSGSPPKTPASSKTAPSDAGAESKDVPSTDNGSSDASSLKMGFSLIFFLIFVASYVSTEEVY